jgi:hypothetical protein
MLRAQDFFAFSDACYPVQAEARGGMSTSLFPPEPDFADENTEVLGLEDFDLSRESPGAWDLSLYGMDPSPFGHL